MSWILKIFFLQKDHTVYIVVVQSLSCIWLFVTPWTAACHTSLSFTISRSLLKFMSIELVMLSNHLIIGHPLLLLPSFFPSIRVFSKESALCIRWPKYWSFSFSFTNSPFNEYSGLITHKGYLTERRDFFLLYYPHSNSITAKNVIIPEYHPVFSPCSHFLDSLRDIFLTVG